MEIHGSPQDPYRIFFPLGILLGVAGVSIWPVYFFGWTSGYSGRAHAFIQIEGFLYAFVVGFLLTALPRFTGTEGPSLAVQIDLAIILTAAVVAFETEHFVAGHALFLAAHVWLFTLAAMRFVRRRFPPPDTFALVGCGIGAGMLGAAINLLISMERIEPSLDLLGRRLLTEGMVLLLVLGVGGFLGPRLLGFAALPNLLKMDTLSIGEARFPIRPRFGKLLHLVAGLGILITLAGEYGLGIAGPAFVRAGIVTTLVMVNVAPWRYPATRTTLAWCVWTAHWWLVIGIWAVALAPAYRVDFLHILFMGAFTLMILAVGTRVTLSHSGHSLAVEQRSWPLRIGITTVVIGMLARIGAPFTPDSFFDHLAYAALLWIGGMAWWGTYLVRWMRKG